MKKLFVSLAAILMAVNSLAALDFSSADALFRSSDFGKSREALESMLPAASAGKEKAEVLWRLSRICLIVGERETTKEGKRAVFGQGIQYAEQAIGQDATNPNAYMWHSANVGRECQTRAMMEQAKKVPVMMNDLTTILDKLGRKDFSEAWQALAEIYYAHPFKSNDAAINFTRQAALNIPSGELRLSTYAMLANILLQRDWSAAKRKSEALKNSSRFKAAKTSNIEKYTYFDGLFADGSAPIWSSKGYIELSDREEALAIVNYSLKLYTTFSEKTSVDEDDYRKLLELKKKF